MKVGESELLIKDIGKGLDLMMKSLFWFDRRIEDGILNWRIDNLL